MLHDMCMGEHMFCVCVLKINDILSVIPPPSDCVDATQCSREIQSVKVRVILVLGFSLVINLIITTNTKIIAETFLEPKQYSKH